MSVGPPLQHDPYPHHVRDRWFALIAPVFWSLAGVTVRFMETADPWQINFYRSATLAVFVLCVLLWRYRWATPGALRAPGIPAVWAGVFVGMAMVCNIFALTRTSVANAVLLMASGPLFAAALARMVLKERTGVETWVAIAMAAFGIVIMVGGSARGGALLGDAVALLGVAFFGAYATALRYVKKVDMTPAVLFAGIYSAGVGALTALATGVGLAPPLRDIALSAFLGVFQLGVGSVLFALAARSVPAVELTVFSLGEPVLAPVWAWIGVGEIPQPSTLIGGGIILLALLLHMLGGRPQRPHSTIGEA